MSGQQLYNTKYALLVQLQSLLAANILVAMKLIIAAIYTKLRTHIIDDTDIEQVDSLMAPPKGDKLILGFEYA